MTCDRTYRCDICHDRIDPARGHEQGAGLWWAAASKRPELRPVRGVERHVCNHCADAIAELWPALRQALAATGGR